MNDPRMNILTWHSELGGTKLITKILPNQAMQSKLVFLITNCTKYDEIASEKTGFFSQRELFRCSKVVFVFMCYCKKSNEPTLTSQKP